MALGSVNTVRMDLSFKNAGAVIANIYAADEQLQRRVRKLVREAGRYMHDLAFFLSPVDTEFMRDHLRVLYGAGGYTFEVGWREEDFAAAALAFYPLYQEFGTRFMAAQPSLYPAYKDTQAWFLRELRDEIRAGIRRAATRR